MHAQGRSEAEHLHAAVQHAVMHAAVTPVVVLGLQPAAALGLDPGAAEHAVEDTAGLVAPAGWPSHASAVPGACGKQSYGFSMDRGVHQAAKQARQQLVQAHCVHTWTPPQGLFIGTYIHKILTDTPVLQTGLDVSTQTCIQQCCCMTGCFIKRQAEIHPSPTHPTNQPTSWSLLICRQDK